MDPHYILALNSGSSSLKFALYEFDGSREELVIRGEAEDIAARSSRLWLRAGDGSSVADQSCAISNHAGAVKLALDALRTGKCPEPAAIGHRVVMGGSHSAPEKVTAELLGELRALIPLAPLHLPAEVVALPQTRDYDLHLRIPLLSSFL